MRQPRPSSLPRWQSFLGRHRLTLTVLSCTFVALILRWDFAVEVHPPELYLMHDMAAYAEQGQALTERTRVAWDTFTPIGYPAFLALVGGVDSAAVWQVVLGSFTAGIAVLTTFKLDGSHAAAALAGVVVAGYTPLIFYTGLVLTETLCAFLLVSFACLMLHASDTRARNWAAAAGVSLGLAIAVRPSFLMLLPFLLWAAVRRRDAACRWALGAALVVILPIALHTSVLLGRPAINASNGGVNFFLAHAECRTLRSTGGGRIVQLSTHYSRAHLSEACVTERAFLEEAHFYRLGLRELRAHPERLLRAVLALGEGVGLAPFRAWPEQPYWPGSMDLEDTLNAFSRAFYWVLLAPALLHAAARHNLASGRHRHMLWMILGSVLAVLYLFNGNPRVRVSSDPISIALAASAWTAAVQYAYARLAKARAQMRGSASV